MSSFFFLLDYFVVSFGGWMLFYFGVVAWFVVRLLQVFIGAVGVCFCFIVV